MAEHTHHYHVAMTFRDSHELWVPIFYQITDNSFFSLFILIHLSFHNEEIIVVIHDVCAGEHRMGL